LLTFTVVDDIIQS